MTHHDLVYLLGKLVLGLVLASVAFGFAKAFKR